MNTKPTSLKSEEQQQRESLRALLHFGTNPAPGSCNFGAMLFVSRPGDQSFLAPIAPELRGVEIVSAWQMPDGRDYDIWRFDPGTSEQLRDRSRVESGLTAAQVFEWLGRHCRHTEAVYGQHIVEWTEDVMRFYRVPRKSNPQSNPQSN